MVCDALALAAGPLGLRDAVAGGCDSPDALAAYLRLDDSLLQRLAALRPHETDTPRDVEQVGCVLGDCSFLWFVVTCMCYNVCGHMHVLQHLRC